MRLICALRDKSFRICFNFDVSLKRAVLSVTEKDIKFVVEPIAKKLFFGVRLKYFSRHTTTFGPLQQ